jgi:hypothetical protein
MRVVRGKPDLVTNTVVLLTTKAFVEPVKRSSWVVSFFRGKLFSFLC